MAATLAGVKAALGITGTYQDATISEYFADVVSFLEGGGVPADKITDGVVARGVSDLWNYGAGEGKLSTYFMQRAAQLALKNP